VAILTKLAQARQEVLDGSLKLAADKDPDEAA
jgi:hypothetical protein